MARLMNTLMLSCRKATELMEKKMNVNLKFVEKFQLFLHTRMCDACTLYEKQSQFIDIVLRGQSVEPRQDAKVERRLPDNVKLEIIRELGRQ